MKLQQVPGTEVDIEVPDGEPPDVTERRMRSAAEWWKKSHQSDVPVVSEENVTPTDYPWYQDAWQGAKALGLGSIRGVGKVADWGLNIGDTIINDAQSLTGNTPTREQNDQPVTDLHDRYMPAPPAGWSGTYDIGETYGPFALDALLSGGTRSLFQQSLRPLGQMIPKAARDFGLGVAGGEGGRVVAETVAPGNGDLGSLLGSVSLANAGPRLSRLAGNRLLMTPQSGEKLATIDRANANLPPDAQIPVTVGPIGSKMAGTMEDTSGMSMVSQRAEATRRQFYENLERGAVQNLDEMRGGPATAQITQPDVGIRAETAIGAAEGRIEARINAIQDNLENLIGSGSQVDLRNVLNELQTTANNTAIGAESRASAAAIAQRLQEEVQFRHALPPNMMPITPTADYGAIKDTRSDLGRMSVPNTQGPGGGGNRLKGAVQSQGYGGMTEAMKDTASQAGVPVPVFDAVQAETSSLYKQAEDVSKLRGTNEASTASKVHGQGSSTQLDPLLQHAPDETLQALVDHLELGLRGNSAGRAVDPTAFKVANFDAWRGLSPERKAILAKNNPALVQQMDDLAEVAQLEATRSGQRTRPTGGNTMGASNPFTQYLGPLAPAIIGGGGGALAGGPATAAAGAAAATILPWLYGRALTSPTLARILAENKGPGLAEVFDRSIRAALPNATLHETDLDRQRREAREQRGHEAVQGGP